MEGQGVKRCVSFQSHYIISRRERGERRIYYNRRVFDLFTIGIIFFISDLSDLCVKHSYIIICEYLHECHFLLDSEALSLCGVFYREFECK